MPQFLPNFAGIRHKKDKGRCGFHSKFSNCKLIMYYVDSGRKMINCSLLRFMKTIPTGFIPNGQLCWISSTVA